MKDMVTIDKKKHSVRKMSSKRPTLVYYGFQYRCRTDLAPFRLRTRITCSTVLSTRQHGTIRALIWYGSRHVRWAGPGPSGRGPGPVVRKFRLALLGTITVICWSPPTDGN